LHFAVNGLSGKAFFMPARPRPGAGRYAGAVKSAIVDSAYYLRILRFYLKHLAQLAGISAIVQP
jgi:hypothetical protein